MSTKPLLQRCSFILSVIRFHWNNLELFQGSWRSRASQGIASLHIKLGWELELCGFGSLGSAKNSVVRFFPQNDKGREIPRSISPKPPVDLS